MKTGVIAGLASVVFVLFVSWYFISPFAAFRSLAAAARTNDKDVLSIAVDFPSVREDLKGQFNVFVATKAQSDPSLKGNPFAGLAMLLVPVMVDRVVDTYVTPDGLTLLLQPEISEKAHRSLSSVILKSGYSFIDSDHFRVTLNNDAHPDQPLMLVLERRGFFTWKLTRVDLPLNEISRAAMASKSASPPDEAPPAAPDAEVNPQPAPVEPPDDFSEAVNGPLPQVVGRCSKTMVKSIENRLENSPGSGSAINYSNGGYQVSYDQIPGIDQSLSGDQVVLCLVSVPQDCPPGDDRGRIYRAKNLRTLDVWEEPDSEHSCGGA